MSLEIKHLSVMDYFRKISVVAPMFFNQVSYLNMSTV